MRKPAFCICECHEKRTNYLGFGPFLISDLEMKCLGSEIFKNEGSDKPAWQSSRSLPLFFVVVFFHKKAGLFMAMNLASKYP